MPNSSDVRLKKNDGFTIVETLIVLAIAGLILLIVFEAIPALNRSSRNHTRKQDVAVILQAVSHYELSNSGSMPTDGTFLSAAKLSFYDPTNIIITNQTAAQAALVGPIAPYTDINHVQVYDYERCSTTTFGGTVTSGTDYTDIVALFGIESGSGTDNAQCQQL